MCLDTHSGMEPVSKKASDFMCGKKQSETSVCRIIDVLEDLQQETTKI